jgi:hypothetical protein
MGLPEIVLQPRLVNREFKVAIRDKFFQKNTFEVYPKAVASEWLKRMSKLGLLNSIRKLKIDPRFSEEDQAEAQFHRICTAAASMEMLERLVVILDTTGLWYFPLYEVA